MILSIGQWRLFSTKAFDKRTSPQRLAFLANRNTDTHLMKACFDVYYQGNTATVACVLFDDWSQEEASHEEVLTLDTPSDYEPGQFYKRELPCLLALIEALPECPNTILVDGYVSFGHDRPGLGKRLYDELKQAIPVIGIAKSEFETADTGTKILRGESERPLFVTAVGMEEKDAAAAIQKMHGPYRMPTLLKRVDHLSRNAE